MRSSGAGFAEVLGEQRRVASNTDGATGVLARVRVSGDSVGPVVSIWLCLEDGPALCDVKTIYRRLPNAGKGICAE